MRAIAKVGKQEFQLYQIHSFEMNEVLEDRKRSSIMGIPVYFDETERVWPFAAEGVTVQFLEEEA